MTTQQNYMQQDHIERLKARFAELNELPYVPERIDGHLALSAEAEAADDFSFRCKLLVWISDDYMETGDEPRMIEYFDRAWALFLAHRDEVDEYVRYNLRTTFGPSIEALSRNPDVPAEQVLARMDAMDAFYREYGYSMRIPHRTRYWFHRRRDENDLATEQVELLIAAPGDNGAHCDAMGPMVGAQWYQGPGRDRDRAIELWRSIVQMPDQRCPNNHQPQALAELMYLSALEGDGGEARYGHRFGYPLIRRVPNEWRNLDLHMSYANRARDVAGFMRIVHDHIELLDAPLDDDVAWFQGRVLQFLHLLTLRGHGALPITLADRSEITADRLRERLDAVLTAHAESQPDEAERKRYTDRLASFRDTVLDKLELPPEIETDKFWDTRFPPVPAPWAASPDLEDLPKGWSAQDALLAEARVLDFIEHPHSEGAWARVAALGTPRSPVDQARIAEYRSDVLVRDGDFASGRAMQLMAAELFEHAGRPNEALYNRVLAALAAFLSQQREVAISERDIVVATARARHDAGLMSDGELLGILVEDFRLNSIIEIMTFGADPNQLMDNTETNEKFSVASRLYLDKRSAHGPWANLVDAWGFYRQQMSRLYGRYGVLPEFVRETTAKVDYWYARARDGYRDALMFPQQAERELSRGQNLLDAELFEDAERAAVEAARLNAGLNLKNVGKTRLLQAQAIAAGLDADASRDDELLAAAREAASLLAGDDEEDAATARVLIGDVLRRAERYESALDVYLSAVRSLADAWGRRPERDALRRATAGRIVCLRRLDRADEARALLDDLTAQLPDWNRVMIGWIRHDAGVAFQHLGDEKQAMIDFDEAIRISREAGKLDPHCSALLHAAEMTAPEDRAAALGLADEAAALIGAVIEKELGEAAERRAGERERAIARGESPKPEEPPNPDPIKLARQARVKTTKVRLLLDPEPAPDDVLERLLSAAFRSAVEGADTLVELVRATAQEDPRRRSLLEDLAGAIGWLATVQRGTGDAAGAAERYTAFAAFAEECGFPDFAATAKENAQALAPEPAAAAV